MDKQTRKYRKNELAELKKGGEWYTVRLLDWHGGKTKYMNITPEELAAISAVLLGGLKVKEDKPETCAQCTMPVSQCQCNEG